MKDLDSQAIVHRLTSTGNDFAEEYIIQHRNPDEIISFRLNTLRIVTQLTNNDEVEIMGQLFEFLFILVSTIGCRQYRCTNKYFDWYG